MKKERTILLITMILNFLITIIKLSVGLLFHFSSLIADALHSFSDFITDIVSSLASFYSRQRATKKYPFGYGLLENIANLFIGIVLFSLGIFIFVEGLMAPKVIFSPFIFITLLLVIVLKLIVIFLLKYYGQKNNSPTLLLSAKESYTDFISSVIVLIVSIMLLFQDVFPVLSYADKVGSIIISLIVFKLALPIIIQNIHYLIGMNILDHTLDEEIAAALKPFKKIKGYKQKLLKLGMYYNLYLTIEVNENMTLKQWMIMQRKIKKTLKSIKIPIKYIEIEPGVTT